MPVPNNIQNGDVPDASLLMANFNFLGDGKGLRRDTYSGLRAFAQTAPDTPFLCLASDTMQLLFYCGNTSCGEDGFLVVAGG